jgi:hypothetical protein
MIMAERITNVVRNFMGYTPVAAQPRDSTIKYEAERGRQRGPLRSRGASFFE